MLESRVGNNDSNSSSRSNNQNVAVVGGSAAGLFTASLLARKGVPVRVFERIETLEPAERTLIVTHRMRNLLGALRSGASSTKSGASSCSRMAAARTFP